MGNKQNIYIEMQFNQGLYTNCQQFTKETVTRGIEEVTSAKTPAVCLKV